MLLALRNQKSKVFDDRVITCEFVRKAKEIAKQLKIKPPDEILLNS